MQLPAKGCTAIPADNDQTARCPSRASPPHPFCREHAEEHRALEEKERTAAREAERLKPVVDYVTGEDVEGYTTLREVRKDETVVRLYLGSLDEQMGAAVALRRRFFSEAEDRGSASLDAIAERKESVAAFLAKLGDKASALEQQRNAPQHEPGLVSADPPPVLATCTDEPPAYPILDTPHPPCACTADSSDKDADPHRPPGRCTAMRLRDGNRCTWSCLSGKRFCPIHCVAHGAAVVPHKVAEGMLEVQRVKIMRAEQLGEKARRIDGVKQYLDKLEDMVTTIEEHQRLFLCRTTNEHTALLDDLKKRRTSAALLLGQLSGRQDARIAENQGQTETWATEFLAEEKQKDATERRKAAADLLTGATISGASLWLGVPWAQSMVYGAVTAFVARSARDAKQAS